ncbi:glycosyltransferase [Flavobacterium sp.]|uniref:glycosyltransferase n=1 Tax=Flavobacterium sp. TaxID=239 RepID=UPI002B4B6C0F|nr:glycosyltransferase [Flavobacterium sp.]HLP64555.1 glycosyltransferase [Flavobacterium sp.]
MENSKRLLIIGFVWPEPKSSAAGTRMMQLIELFQSNDYEVTFASTAQNLDFSEDLEALGLTAKSIQINSSAFDEFVKELNPTVVVFDRFMVEEQFGWRVSESCPSALKILDTIDLHLLRNARQMAVKGNREFVSDDLYSDVAKREIASILRCDLSLMVSEYEMDLLQSQFKISDDLLHYLPLFAEPQSKILSFDEREDFVFIGNFMHEPNWDAVQVLYSEIWPSIHAKLPLAKMLVYGAYPTQKVLELNKPKMNFYSKGRAEDALKVIQEAKVVLAPLRFGAGIKGKLLEAMQCGTPSVTTSIGAESMKGDLEWNGFIADDPIEFARSAIELYSNQIVWEKSKKNGFDILKERYKKSSFDTTFLERIKTLSDKLKEHRNQNFIGSLLQHHTLSSTKYMSKWIEEKNKKL